MTGFPFRFAVRQTDNLQKTPDGVTQPQAKIDFVHDMIDFSRALDISPPAAAKFSHFDTNNNSNTNNADLSQNRGAHRTDGFLFWVSLHRKRHPYFQPGLVRKRAGRTDFFCC